ncbi:hypothetical protein BN1058_02735 [Paraliobacillus sp. PM-2]|uniref:hypothetical protein n=1 Tax=Paraliobacillus sp. PM-2 TaxID=1462524 RepID=UPI00061C05A8|nr:hypothetical protein [Paraliobacillus sp. PM-2]CQR48367.1 hypothetical protein BN1058_02735 [Paraliobacillus sp. PM-2]
MNKVSFKIEEKLQELDLQREAFISKVKRIMDNNRTMEEELVETEGQLLAYFSHSCNMTDLEGQDNLIIGSLTIHNHTSKPVNQLSVGLVIKAENEYQFSGKYVTETNQGTQSMLANWKRQMDKVDKHTYWFQWIGEQPIQPFSTVAFSDFTITWKNDSPFYCSVEGFIYTEELKDGIQVNNKISLQLD